MGAKLSDEKIRYIQELYQHNLTVAEAAEKAGVSYSSAWLVKNGFETRGQYKRHLAQNPPDTRTIYEKLGITPTDRKKQLRHERKADLRNQEISDFIKTGLNSLGKNLDWLALQIGKSRDTVRNYSSGLSMPDDETLDRICVVFQYGANVEEFLETASDD
jgi:transcriptional regulator with XRE-family HTH domain